MPAAGILTTMYHPWKRSNETMVTTIPTRRKKQRRFDAFAFYSAPYLHHNTFSVQRANNNGVNYWT